jgi:hypothetical protein
MGMDSPSRNIGEQWGCRANSGDILESLLPAMAVCGDTLRILVRGSRAGVTGTRSFADGELIVQRLPEYFDSTQPAMTPLSELNWTNRVYGRRFKVVYFRWLNPGDKR